MGEAEQERAQVASLRHGAISDTQPDATLDDIADIAARTLGCPIAIISLVDKDRIRLGSRLGSTERAHDLVRCGAAVRRDDPWVIENPVIDPQTLTNPLVAVTLGLRFYAGVPLLSLQGDDLGKLAVMDRAPRAISDDQLAILKKLAGLAVRFLEIQLHLRMETRVVGGRITSVA